MYISRNIVAAFAITITTTLSHAVDYDVVFVDANAGVNWQGVVDTTADTLSISQWTVASGDYYAMQKSLPMIFNAVSGASGNYDIPDVWDGNLTNWGFISEHAFTGYSWTDGNGEIAFRVANPSNIGIGVVETYVPESSSFEGKEEIVTPARYDRSYTNAATVFDPVNGRDLSATNFTVVESSVVPEPSSAMLLLVGAAGVLTRRKR